MFAVFTLASTQDNYREFVGVCGEDSGFTVCEGIARTWVEQAVASGCAADYTTRRDWGNGAVYVERNGEHVLTVCFGRMPILSPIQTYVLTCTHKGKSEVLAVCQSENQARETACTHFTLNTVSEEETGGFWVGRTYLTHNRQGETIRTYRVHPSPLSA